MERYSAPSDHFNLMQQVPLPVYRKSSCSIEGIQPNRASLEIPVTSEDPQNILRNDKHFQSLGLPPATVSLGELVFKLYWCGQRSINLFPSMACK